MRTTKLLTHVMIISGMAIACQSCVPVFSELQSARTVGKNKLEITPSFSSVHRTSDEKTEMVQTQVGLHTAYGITSKIDIRLRYEYISGVHVLGIGPKFSLLKDKIAFAMPIGTMWTEDEGIGEIWQVQPTLLLTAPVIKDKLDITLSPKYLKWICGDCDDFAAVNLGLSISNDLTKWSIRPEYGLLFLTGYPGSGHYSHFSVGFSRVF